MEEDTVIKVEGVYKKFCRSLKRSMAYGSVDMLNSFVGRSRNSRLRKGEFWALEDINFELKKGDALGIIGLNGSGKSTLLRVLTGIYPPDRGKISIRGKIGSLIAVGAGFHPHMSGRENIYLNGTILGMKKKEIEEKFDSIVNFADIGGFLDAPVSTYSSGMRVRLGFAVAIHCKPDILLVDEILSVGDLSFRNKSLRYMSEYRKKANALIFVSHDVEQIRNLCNRVIVLDKGKIIYDGNPQEGVLEYQNISMDIRYDALKTENGKVLFGQADSSVVEINDIGVMNANGDLVAKIDAEDTFSVFADFIIKKAQSELILSSGIFDEKRNQVIWVVSNDDQDLKFTNIPPGKYRAMFKYTKHNLMPGVYSFSLGVRNKDSYETFQRITEAGTFVISSKTMRERAVIRTEHQISLEKVNM